MSDKYFSKGFEEEMQKLSKNLVKKAMFGGGFTKTLVGGLASGAAIAVTIKTLQLAGKLISSIPGLGGDKLSPRHKKFIADLATKDHILKDRSAKRVISHYTTMVKLAPSLAMDPNVVSSFLRESTAYDNMSTVTVKSLLDLEQSHAKAGTEKEKKYLSIIPKPSIYGDDD